MMLFALTGLGLRRFSGEPEPTGPGVTLPRLATAIIVALLALAFGYGVGRTGLSDLVYEHANAQSLDVRPVESIAAAEEAIKIDPHNVPALIFLGDMYRMEAAHYQDPEQRAQVGALAADAYARARALSPLDDTITASLGLTYDIMVRYPEAYFCLADAVKHQPYDGHFWFRLGNHFWQTGMLEKAEQAYLMGLNCPHGAEENVEPEKEIRPYLEAQGIPLPAPGTNPLTSGPTVEHYTVP
jgi:cytochrome c-type biogenesis protein CcmH/NrfG